MTRRYGTRVCAICGQEIQPGDVAEQCNGRAMHWDCDEVEGAPV